MVEVSNRKSGISIKKFMSDLCRSSVDIKRVDCYRDGDNELEGAGQPVMTSLVWLWDGNKWSLTG